MASAAPRMLLAFIFSITASSIAATALPLPLVRTTRATGVSLRWKIAQNRRPAPVPCPCSTTGHSPCGRSASRSLSNSSPVMAGRSTKPVPIWPI
jgi:hypothetical protein